MANKAIEFQTIFTELQIELAATKIHCAEVAVKARRTREHVRYCRALRSGSKSSPDPEPIFVNERSGRVH